MKIERAIIGTAGRHRWVAVLVVLALVLRGLVPAGYMVGTAGGADNDGPLTIVLCSEHGVQPGSIVPEGLPDGGDERGGAPCPFALTAHGAPPLPAFASDWPFTVLMGRTVIPTPRLLLARVPTGPAVGSRAPPALS
ncbi:MAG: hypothetical protein NW217_06315 [Hyphomicrobiaceae bacterium]|nr:hypothetical protein [Hyphomicrobiaceae bacterium]